MSLYNYFTESRPSMNTPDQNKPDFTKMTPLEIKKWSSLEYFHYLVKNKLESELKAWLLGANPQYNGEKFGPITSARIETEFGTNNSLVILVKKGGGNTIKIPFSDIDTDHERMFGNLPEASNEWIRTNPESSFYVKPLETNKPSPEPVKKARNRLFAAFREIMEDMGLVRTQKATKTTEPPQMTSPTEIIPEIQAEPTPQEMPLETLVPEPIIPEEVEALTIKDLPEHLPELPPTDTLTETALRPEDLPELPIDSDPVEDFSTLIQEGTAEITPPPVIQEMIREPEATQEVAQKVAPPQKHHISLSNTLAQAVKGTVIISISLSSPTPSTQNHPQKIISAPVPENEKPDPQPEPQEPKSDSTPEKIEKTYLEETITPGTTIYSLSKKHNLGNQAWFQYRKYWRVKNADGSLMVPLDVRLPIGAKLIYSTENFPVQKSISKTIEPHYTIWQFCQDNALSEKYWQHPENFFRVQFPGKTEFQTPDIYHLPVHGTLHFDKDGFGKPETNESLIQEKIVQEKQKTIGAPEYEIAQFNANRSLSDIIDSEITIAEEIALANTTTEIISSTTQPQGERSSDTKIEREPLYPEQGKKFMTGVGQIFESHSIVYYRHHKDDEEHPYLVLGRGPDLGLILQKEGTHQAFCISPKTIRERVRRV